MQLNERPKAKIWMMADVFKDTDDSAEVKEVAKDDYKRSCNNT